MGADWTARKMVIRDAVKHLLVAIGEDIERDGLKDTPDRVARFWQEFIEHDASAMASFAISQANDDLVAVKGMEVWSLCEHHLLPFRMNVSAGYIPGNYVLGLSKFARLANRHAHRLQIQERFAHEYAADLGHYASTRDVAVIVRGEHTCMSMRGVKVPAVLHTSVMLGRFRSVPQLRAEFMALVGAG